MTLSFVLFLFLAHLGIGIVFTLVLVSRVAGVKFFRFNAGFAAALLLLVLWGISTTLAPDEALTFFVISLQVFTHYVRLAQELGQFGEHRSFDLV